jgi:hypothetical protein
MTNECCSAGDATERAKAIVEEAWRQTCVGPGEFDDYAVPLIAAALTSTEPQALPVGPRELKPITMSDVRLMAGEGKLFPADVLNAVNAVLKMRLSSLLPRPQRSTQGD